MQTSENTIYLNFTKSIVNGFEEFVANVEKHGNVLEDDELRYKLKLIDKTLQSIFNKWEETPDKKHSNSTPGEITPKEIVNVESLKKSDSWDDFDSIIASSVGDVPVKSQDFSILDDLKSMLHEKENISSMLSDEEQKNSESRDEPINPLTRKEAEIVRKFNVENVKTEWVLGPNGFYVKEFSRGSWTCYPCKKEALSYDNIISHASGIKHIRKLVHYDRESSTTTQNIDTNLNPDLNFVTNAQPELIKMENDADIQVSLKGFYCHACRGTLNSEEALKLHLNGGKHRKNYES